MADYSKWRERAKQWIKSKKLTHQWIAAEMERSRATIGHWLSGHNKINLDEFFTLCDVIKADPQEILFGRSSIAKDGASVDRTQGHRPKEALRIADAWINGGLDVRQALEATAAIAEALNRPKDLEQKSARRKT